MIVFGIAAIWLTLTVAGYGWLSLLGRAAAREATQAEHGPSQLQIDALAGAGAPIPKALLG
jgi:hypothetical protein